MDAAGGREPAQRAQRGSLLSEHGVLGSDQDSHERMAALRIPLLLSLRALQLLVLRLLTLVLRRRGRPHGAVLPQAAGMVVGGHPPHHAWRPKLGGGPQHHDIVVQFIVILCTDSKSQGRSHAIRDSPHPPQDAARIMQSPLNYIKNITPSRESTALPLQRTPRWPTGRLTLVMDILRRDLQRRPEGAHV